MIERTVTEQVATPAKGGGEEASAKELEEEKQDPRRVARCDIRKRDWAPLPRPATCPSQVDYGQGLQVAHGGQASIVCAADTALYQVF